MNRFLSNKIIASIVALALLVGVGVLISSGDTSSTTRNAALVAGTPCTKVGQVTKISKQAVICAALSPKNIWYPVFQEKKWICAKLGITRKQNGIFSVCGKNKSSKKRWFLTKPLMANSNPGLPTTDQDAFIKLTTNPELIVETSPTTPLALAVTTETPATETTLAVTTVTTLAPAVPATLSLVTQPLGGANAVALETQPVVQLLDQRGASISTAGITITAVSGRTDVALSGNTAVTDATGRATFTTLSLTGIMGDIALTFTAPRLGLEGVTSGNLDLAAGVATALVSDTKLGAVAAGQQFNQFHKLHLEDSSGNVVALSGRNVVVSSSTEGLSGTTTVPTAKDGYVLFKNLMLTQTGTTTLTFTSGDLSTTSIVEVKSGDLQSLEITTQPSEVAINAVALGVQPVVQLLDAKGNNVTTAGFRVTATITQFPVGAAATNSTLLNPTARTNAQGVATFTGLAIAGLIGDYKLGFTPDNGVTQPSDKTVTLSAGEPKKLIVFTAPSSPEGNSTAGTWSLTQSPVIGLRDISNNPVTKNGVTVTATVTGQDPTFSARTDADGKAEIPITFNGASAGLRTITYKASNVNDLTVGITLPLLTPVVTRALTVPAGKSITSQAFPLTAPMSNSNGAWTYTSSATTIATVSTAGIVTIHGLVGTVTITATQLATPKYESATTTAELDVARYSVGDVGPGGGKVFYVAATPQYWGRYLEAAPTDYKVGTDVRTMVPWGCQGTFMGTDTAIGTGKANTSAILTNCKTPGIAADVANKYSTRTAVAGQWYLPSKDELYEMWANRAAIDGSFPTWYWSSSEVLQYEFVNGNWTGGYYSDFSSYQTLSGWQFTNDKNSPLYVRPVRAS